MSLMHRFFAACPEPEQVVTEMPQGFFRLRFDNGRPDCVAYNHPCLGLMWPVRDEFVCAGQIFRRERDEHGRFLALKVFVRQVARSDNVFTGRNNEPFADTDRLEGFDGDFQYSPLV